MNGMLSFAAYVLLNMAFCIIISPLLMSLIKKVKAYCQGRRGPPLLQGYYNLIKLLRKETIYSQTSSGIMRMTPYVNMVFLLAACVCVPLAFIPSQPGFVAFGSMVLFLYLLAMAKFFMALGGMDAGSTFGGMGSSREMSLSAVFEPIIIIVFASLAVVLKTTSFFEMFLSASGSMLFLDPSVVLATIALFIVLIVETSRVPIDNPETHLELTMVHEAMILEQSGRNLAMMELSHAVKQTLLMAIIINIIFPIGISGELSAVAVAVAMAAFLAKAAILSVIVGVFESSTAKLRLFRLPSLFMIAFFLSFMTIIFEVFA